MVGGMNIKELQEELVEKISLIPTEDDRSSLERALEIINQLGKDHINDVITIYDAGYTALDYISIFDSQGNNPTLSRRPRINNMMLVELENAIRNVEGRTSEELGLVQIETNTHRAVPNYNTPAENQITPLHHAVMNGNLEMVRYLIELNASTNLEDVTTQSSVEGRENHP